MICQAKTSPCQPGAPPPALTLPTLILVEMTHPSAALCPRPHLSNQFALLVHADVLLALRPLDADPAAKRIRLHDELGYDEGKEERPLSISCWLRDVQGVPPSSLSLKVRPKGWCTIRLAGPRGFLYPPYTSNPLTQELGRNLEARQGRIQVVWGKGQVLPNLLPSSAVAEMRRPVTCTCLPLVRLYSWYSRICRLLSWSVMAPWSLTYWLKLGDG